MPGRGLWQEGQRQRPLRESDDATRGHCDDARRWYWALFKNNNKTTKIVPVVDGRVNTIYSRLQSRSSRKPFQPLQPTSAILYSGTIVNTALNLTSIRPASGRSLVHVQACGGFDSMPSVRTNKHQSHVYSANPAASLRIGKLEDQVLPGGGCA